MRFLPRRSRVWIWFFAILACLVIIWTGGSLLFQRYYWGAAVTPATLADARALWRASGAADYDLELVFQGNATRRLAVHVRADRVVYAEPDPRPLAEKGRDYGMPALFALIERQLHADQQSGDAGAACARFDPHDGHLIRYTHHVRSTGESMQVIVTQFRPCTAMAESN